MGWLTLTDECVETDPDDEDSTRNTEKGEEFYFSIEEIVKQKLSEFGVVADDIITAPRQLAVGDVLISLTSDAYEYNREFFTLEVSNPAEDANDADIADLRVDASEVEILSYITKVRDAYINGGYETVNNVASQLKRAIQ